MDMRVVWINRPSVAVMGGGMLVLRPGDFDGGQRDTAMMHASFRNQAFGEIPDLAGGTAQQRHFEAVLMVEMDVEGRQDHVMVAVLRVGEPLREVALMMVVYIRDTTDRIARIG